MTKIPEAGFGSEFGGGVMRAKADHGAEFGKNYIPSQAAEAMSSVRDEIGLAASTARVAAAPLQFSAGFKATA
jgi:hypothetical protein